MKIEFEDLQSGGPVPVLWWRKHGVVGMKKTARKQIALADSVASQLWEVYGEELIGSVTHWRSGAGQIAVSQLNLHSAPCENHRRLVAKLCAELLPEDDELRKWILNNEGDVRDLVDWFLMHKWFTYGFSIGLITNMGPPGPDEQVFDVKNPDQWAVGHADALWLAVSNEESPNPFESSLDGMQLANERPVDPPPWEMP